MKKFIYVFLGFLLVSLACFICASFFGYKYIKEKYPYEKLEVNSVQVSLASGESLKDFSQKLQSQNVIKNKELFYLWVRFFSNYSKYQKGTYLFDGQISPSIIDNMITKGDIYEPVVFKVTIPEGYNFRQICEKIVSLNDSYALNDCLELFSDKELINKYGIEGENLEGYLYPLTYSFTKMPTLREIIETMIDTFFKKLPSNYTIELSKVKLSLKEAVTFASLIELESADPNERGMISGVIWNRLRARMPLGIDASLVYGIKDYNGNIRHKDLKDSDNKFNTRIYLGLPPTPIASPSVESLLAVINPKEHNFYYYVLSSEDKKSHIFSKSLREHNILVKKLVKSYKNR